MIKQHTPVHWIFSYQPHISYFRECFRKCLYQGAPKVGPRLAIRDFSSPQCQPNQTYCTAGEGLFSLFAGLEVDAYASIPPLLLRLTQSISSVARPSCCLLAPPSLATTLYTLQFPGQSKVYQPEFPKFTHLLQQTNRHSILP